jgi:hypothetical protein
MLNTLTITGCFNPGRPKYGIARFETANRPTGFDAGWANLVMKKVRAGH